MSKINNAFNIIIIMFILLVIATLFFLWLLFNIKPSNIPYALILYGIIILILMFLLLILMIMFEGDSIK